MTYVLYGNTGPFEGLANIARAYARIGGRAIVCADAYLGQAVTLRGDVNIAECSVCEHQDTVTARYIALLGPFHGQTAAVRPRRLRAGHRAVGVQTGEVQLRQQSTLDRLDHMQQHEWQMQCVRESRRPSTRPRLGGRT